MEWSSFVTSGTCLSLWFAQVRKTSQAALLALLEQELIERFDVETRVCPVLIELTAPDSNDDVKTEAVAVSGARFRLGRGTC